MAGLTWNDVKDLNPALRARETAKPTVWPKPDYQAMIDGGKNPIIVHLINRHTKQIYERSSLVYALCQR